MLVKDYKPYKINKRPQDDFSDSEDEKIPDTDKLRMETDYSANNEYAELQQEMNWFYDGFQTNVIHQLKIYHEKNAHSKYDIANMKIIDIACGDGNYSRLLADLFNYKKIYAVDISNAQIVKALNQTDPKEYPNISYESCDASKLHHNAEHEWMKQQFDIAILPWFLSYAADKNILNRYIQSVNYVLKPKGFIVGCTESIKNINDLSVGIYMKNPRFHMEVPEDNPCQEGIWIHLVGSKKFKFVEYLYTEYTYSKLFSENGFRSCHFLESNEWKTGQHSSKYEQQLFSKAIDYKGCWVKMFIAQKS
eukprot:127538_1